ncbi:MAG: 4Fe-4S binding protein [Candidatus Aminicenantes bacterium]|nr:4Fe-4S binding protein [Candidatus Aminicenantes bacterium]
MNISLQKPPIVPEGKKLAKNEDTCLHCGLCLSLCPFNVFNRDDHWKIKAQEEACQLCGLCLDACPVKAIAIKV